MPVYFCQSFWFERSGHKTIMYQRLREQTTVADHTDRLTDRTKRLLAQKKCRNCHHECQSRLLKQSADGMASKRHISKSFGDHKFSVIFFLSSKKVHSPFPVVIPFSFLFFLRLFVLDFARTRNYLGNCFGWWKVILVGRGLFWSAGGWFVWLGIVLVG